MWDRPPTNCKVLEQCLPCHRICCSRLSFTRHTSTKTHSNFCGDGKRDARKFAPPLQPAGHLEKHCSRGGAVWVSKHFTPTLKLLHHISNVPTGAKAVLRWCHGPLLAPGAARHSAAAVTHWLPVCASRVTHTRVCLFALTARGIRGLNSAHVAVRLSSSHPCCSSSSLQSSHSQSSSPRSVM